MCPSLVIILLWKIMEILTHDLVCTVNLIFIFIVNRGHGLLKKPIIKT